MMNTLYIVFDCQRWLCSVVKLVKQSPDGLFNKQHHNVL